MFDHCIRRGPHFVKDLCLYTMLLVLISSSSNPDALKIINTQSYKQTHTGHNFINVFKRQQTSLLPNVNYLFKHLYTGCVCVRVFVQWMNFQSLSIQCVCGIIKKKQGSFSVVATVLKVQTTAYACISEDRLRESEREGR